MRAIIITSPGPADVLQIRDVPKPVPRAGEILVRIAATAVNRADLLQRMGRYAPPAGWPEDIPGLEYAGTVDSVGAGVDSWQKGDRVMGLAGGGTYAEYLAVPANEAMRAPPSVGLVEAAALPEAFIVAWDAIVLQAGLRQGQTVLIHGVGSGVGTAAVQIAFAVGARSLGTSRSAWKRQRAQQKGLDIAIDPAAGFAEAVIRETGGQGVNVILDLVGGDYLEGNVACLALHGHVVIVGVVGGATAMLDMRGLMRRRASIHGTLMRSRSSDEKAAVTSAFADFALPLFESGALEPVIDSILPLEAAADAHRRIESNESYGKVVLRVD
jgi:putative PIG3 family NAD(P)H quinone oxidoreductase